MMIFPSGYVTPWRGGIFNPYYGGFGHVNLPVGGIGYTYPAFTFPYYFQTAEWFAIQAGFTQ